LTLLFFKIDI